MIRGIADRTENPRPNEGKKVRVGRCKVNVPTPSVPEVKKTKDDTVADGIYVVIDGKVYRLVRADE